MYEAENTLCVINIYDSNFEKCTNSYEISFKYLFKGPKRTQHSKRVKNNAGTNVIKAFSFKYSTTTKSTV